MSLTGKVTVSLDLKSVVARDLSTTTDPVIVSLVKTITNGVNTANAATQVYSDNVAIGTSATVVTDMKIPLAFSAVGQAMAWTRCILVYIANKCATSVLTVGVAGTTNWTRIPPTDIPAGGIYLIYAGTAAGFPVDGTNHDLAVVCDGGTGGTFDIVLAGSPAA